MMTRHIKAENVSRFMRLFSGLDSAFGTGDGGWIKRPPTEKDFVDHLEGDGPGIGIAPLRKDGTVSFAAIDLDEPNFELARELASLLPGSNFIEKSRSGNAHVFAFFKEPIEGWIPRGIMREATAAVNRKSIEVFPKQDRLRDIGMLGNYINLSYYGDQRPMLVDGQEDHVYSLEEFLDVAESTLNIGNEWRKRAHWLGVLSPEDREHSRTTEFGTQSTLHCCAEYALQHREDNPIVAGTRAVAYFSLSKMFANCNQFSDEEAITMLGLINEASPDPINDYELRRIYFNAERGRYTSTGCDDPLFLAYADPECPLAFPHRNKR